MAGRKVISFSVKSNDTKALELIEKIKGIVNKEALPSFSYVMIEALKEYVKNHYDKEE